MTIKKENLEHINRLEAKLQDQLIWIARTGVQDIKDTIRDFRTFRQFLIGLSVAIVGIIFPLLLIVGKSKINDSFLIACALFSYVIVYGLIDLMIPIVRELSELPKVSEKQGDKLLAFIKELHVIKKIEENDDAGLQLQALQKRYSESTVGHSIGFLRSLWYRYETHVFFGAFIVGYIFLIAALFENI